MFPKPLNIIDDQDSKENESLPCTANHFALAIAAQPNVSFVGFLFFVIGCFPIIAIMLSLIHI